MAFEPKYRKNEEEILKANVQTQAAATAQKETMARLSELRPVVTSAVDHQRVVAQQIIGEAWKSLEKAVPRDSALRTLLG